MCRSILYNKLGQPSIQTNMKYDMAGGGGKGKNFLMNTDIFL